MNTKKSKILIIAEAGVNHNGDIELAKKLIDVASSCGADYIKFQTFKADKIASESADLANYQKNFVSDINQQNMLKKLELSLAEHMRLYQYCQKNSVNYLSTAFDDESLDFLIKLKLQHMKVPSGELTNLPYLRKIAALNKKVILSTGMANLEEIEQALLAFETEGLKRDKVTVLQCTTDYPAPMADINLRAMETIKNKLGVKVGYSDHTQGWEVAIAAAALGAEVIEKHFTLDRNMIGPDHAASLEPDELFKMIVQIRNVELAMGSAYKRPSIKELSNSKLIRKSIFAKTKIHIGEKFSSDNLTTKRPGSGISPMKWDSLIGQNSIKNYDKDEQICVSELVRS